MNAVDGLATDIRNIGIGSWRRTIGSVARVNGSVAMVNKLEEYHGQ